MKDEEKVLLGIGALGVFGLGGWLLFKALSPPIASQLSSIKPYLVQVIHGAPPGVVYTYPRQEGTEPLKELVEGEFYLIQVSQPCSLVYGDFSWLLDGSADGWYQVTWLVSVVPNA